MTALTDYIRVTTTRLNVEVNSLDSLRYVMLVLKEVRDRESSIEMEITPILDMYQMLEHYLPGGLLDKVTGASHARGLWCGRALVRIWMGQVLHCSSVA